MYLDCDHIYGRGLLSTSMSAHMHVCTYTENVILAIEPTLQLTFF